MALPKNAAQREHEKFVEDSSGDVAVRTKTTESALPSGAATSAKQDTIITDLENILTEQENTTDELDILNSLVPSLYDFISFSYDGDNVTGIVFKSGGSGGTTISTLTLAYSGSNIVSVTKT